jgi:hypothetical protein
MSYALTADDIEFDSGSVWPSDPKFVELGLIGATEPASIELGPFLGFELGEIAPGTAYSTLHGRRSTSLDGIIIEGRNSEGLALAMSWEAKRCRVAGQLVGEAQGDGDEGTFEASVDQDGALLSASTSATVQVAQPLGTKTYELLAVDHVTSADTDTVDVSVVHRRVVRVHHERVVHEAEELRGDDERRHPVHLGLGRRGRRHHVDRRCRRRHRQRRRDHVSARGDEEEVIRDLSGSGAA